MNIHQGALVGKRLGKYELLALLAVGGTAEIYLARIDGEAGFEKYVVVKCLLDHLADESEYVKMFLDEARLGAQLDHSNIVQTLELGEHEGRYFMAMEYLAGMSLAQLARKTNQRVAGGRLPIELVLAMAAQTCAGLHYAHRKPTANGTPLNLVHRDISPQNLVVSFEGILKIVDFGIAKADFRDTKTQSGTIKGKFAYMSPEQCLAKKVDFRTDIFALGVILHELLTARRLFKRTTTYETYEAIIKGKVPKPSEVNPDLDGEIDRVVMKALEYRKEDRYESAEALGQALLSLLHKRGKHVNASDIATYYKTHFGTELKEHGDRMRLLITGKRQSAVGEDSVNWGDAEIDGSEPEEESEILIELEGSMIESIESIEAADSRENEPLEAVATVDSFGNMDDIISGVTDGGVSESLSPQTLEHDVPEGATRVEVNPMALIDPVQPSASGIGGLATQIQTGMTRPEEKPSVMGAQRTIAPGGVAPLPRASQVVPGAGPSAGPSAKTIMPGSLSAAPLPPELPSQPDSAPIGRGKKATRERPTLNIAKPAASPAVDPRQDGPKPRKTVMGVSAPARSPRKPTETANRNLYQSPPTKDSPGPARPSSSPPHGSAMSPQAPPMQGAQAPQPPMAPHQGAPAPHQQPGQVPVPPDTLPPVGSAQGSSPPARPLNQPAHSTDRVRPQQPPRMARPPAYRRPPALPQEPWFVGLVFAVALGVGLGLTLLIASL